ncbi:MAG: flagellar transcriptional regulator FlhC [Desulfovibrionaceae bacterium]|nr:flagellar transcriptional regulator FlhC [Desulfovibrionaceae bacterium]
MALATECAELGSRIRTIQLLTGLSASQLHRLFRHPLGGPRRGRHPDSREWYHTANLLCRIEASIVVVLFRRLAVRGIDLPLALIGAYRHYLAFCKTPPRISFDRAFDLVSHATGRWLSTAKSFSIFACPACKSEYLTGLSLAPANNHDCPFCKLLTRHARDPRIQAAYPSKTLQRDIQLFWVSACRNKSLIPMPMTNSP